MEQISKSLFRKFLLCYIVRLEYFFKKYLKMTFCRSCQSLAGFQLMAAFSDCVNFMTTHCSVFFSSTVSVSIVLFMHYMIKKFPVFFVWLCFKFQSVFFRTESSQAKIFGFLLFSCKKNCFTFWLRKTFDRPCWRKLLLSRFFQQTLKNYFRSFRMYWYSRSLPTITF